MNIQALRQGLADAVARAGIPDMATYGFTPDSVAVPCFYPVDVEIDPNLSYGGDDSITVNCRILTSRSDDQTGQALLDTLLSRNNPASVRAAIMAARGGPGEPALDGACDDLNITRIRGYRLYTIGTEVFYGAEIQVLAIGPGEED